MKWVGLTRAGMLILLMTPVKKGREIRRGNIRPSFLQECAVLSSGSSVPRDSLAVPIVPCAKEAFNRTRRITNS